MGRIKAKTRLVIEQFPDQKEWIGKMFFVLNQFITEVVAAINGELVFGENFSGQEHEYNFVFVSTAATFPQLFKWKLSSPPRAFQLCGATEQTNTTTPAEIMAVTSWKYTDDGNVALTNAARITSAPAVAALQVGKRYRIKVRVTP